MEKVIVELRIEDILYHVEGTYKFTYEKPDIMFGKKRRWDASLDLIASVVVDHDSWFNKTGVHGKKLEFYNTDSQVFWEYFIKKVAKPISNNKKS